MLPIYDLSTEEGERAYIKRVGNLRFGASPSGPVFDAYTESAKTIIAEVTDDQDAAIVRQMRKWTDPDFTADRIRVHEQELAAAERQFTGPLRQAIERAIEHVRTYQSHIMPKVVEPLTLDGAQLGLRFLPVESVGLNVPGGSAVLFSTLIMLAVPALVAGVAVGRIAVASPPPTRRADMPGGEPGGDISPLVLAVCHMLGIERVYRIGGPAAFAAMALGTESVERVDMIAGPSHPSGQAAKMLLAGVVGTDGYYGASEIVTIADDAADPRWVAGDLIAQAEHDPGKCFLIAWQRSVIDAVVQEISVQMPNRKRQAAIASALKDKSCALLASDRAQAVDIANEIACEHVNLAVDDPQAMLADIRHAGEVFLGDQTPVAAGDYYAGPSHCLPTAATARFSSGISVYSFLKRTGTIAYPGGMSPQTIADITMLAEAEGLDGHANSVRLRR